MLLFSFILTTFLFIVPKHSRKHYDQLSMLCCLQDYSVESIHVEAWGRFLCSEAREPSPCFRRVVSMLINLSTVEQFPSLFPGESLRSDYDFFAQLYQNDNSLYLLLNEQNKYCLHLVHFQPKLKYAQIRFSFPVWFASDWKIHHYRQKLRSLLFLCIGLMFLLPERDCL